MKYFAFETHDERYLLLSAVPNELIRGFRLPDFEERIGISKAEYRVLEDSLQPEGEGVYLSLAIAKVLRNALSAVLTKFGSEFQTRTGIDIPAGQALLARLSKFIGEEEQKRSTS